METPKLEDCDSTLDYLIKLDQFIKNKDAPRRELVLKFLNKWLNNKDNKLIALTNFRNRNLKYLPSDENSKQFMIKYFNKYNEEFNLEFEYNEELFTTINVLYFLKHMLKKVGLHLRKSKKDKDELYTIEFIK